MKNQPMREKIFEYVKENYNSKIEYLWEHFPNYAVFRNDKNKKWFGIVMDVDYKKLGIDKNGIVDILNVKVKDLFVKEMLIKQNGILKGYHFGFGNWISILLDGSVETKQIFDLIDESFAVVSKQ